MAPKKTARGLGSLAEAIAEAMPETEPKSECQRQVDEIKERLDAWADFHEVEAMREGIERKIAQIYSKVLGVNPKRRRRLALVQRIEQLACGDKEPSLILALYGAYSGIEDKDLAAAVAVWNSGPGAKPNGQRSKWFELSRILKKHWAESTSPQTLEREARQERKELSARFARAGARRR